jgi:biopolymer transport protein ExbB/TolQ
MILQDASSIRPFVGLLCTVVALLHILKSITLVTLWEFQELSHE